MRVQPTLLPSKDAKGARMPKAYWITFYREVKDPDKLAAYAKLAGPATAPFGSKYLARGTAAAAYESGVLQRVVVTEFESLEKAKAAHDSPGYQAAVKVLGDGAVRDVRIIEALE
jgi:uncharacterized protein (DUF1330 family)